MNVIAAHTPFDHLVNPVIRPRLGQTGVRDPALFHHEGVIHCFYTATWWDGDRLCSTIEHRRSLDLQSWSEPQVIGVPGLCSPGNVLRVGERFVLCCQHYPMTMPVGGARVERHDCRLWLLWSHDLIHWGEPRVVTAGGCTESWSPDSRRQIDPCLIDHEGRYYILCKQGDPAIGRFGLMVSDDLVHWEHVPSERPFFGPHNVPCAGGVENPMILRDGEDCPVAQSSRLVRRAGRTPAAAAVASGRPQRAERHRFARAHRQVGNGFPLLHQEGADERPDRPGLER